MGEFGDVRIAQLTIFPVKSCRGLSLASVQVADTGLEGDRLFMVVDAHGGFLSQRSHPVMATVDASLDEQWLRLRHPTAGAIRVPRRGAGHPATAVVWKDSLPVDDAGDEAAEFFSDLLGRQARLVRLSDDGRRPVDSSHGRPGDLVSFADGFPFLVISTASLEALNARLDTPVSMDRFRPNVVVSGCGPHAEDGWSSMGVGEVILHLVKPCARCSVVTVDQRSGVVGKEPLTTLASYRRDGSHVLFGQNAVHDGRGVLRVGDPVQVKPRDP